MNLDVPKRLDAHVVIGGASHDFDFVRLELLKYLSAFEHVRATVTTDFESVERLDASSCMISYTCNVDPSPAAEAAIEGFMERGGRWLALHATNSLLDWTEEGVASLHSARPFFDILGTAFVAHPPIGPFTVTPTQPDHPLVSGISAFEVEDELYLYEELSDIDVLLETNFLGEAPGFVEADWTSGDGRRPIMYTRKVGRGEVLFFALGHARGHYDAPHRTPYFPVVERGAWDAPEYRELLKRCLSWATQTDPALERKAGAKA